MDCPSCNRLLYSRRNKTCGFCGAELPAEVRFSEDEIAAMKAEQEAIALRRAKDKAKEEEEKKRKKAAGDGGFYMPPIG
jgi:DNA-directed RNA polymerase subunit M/transcription elongation factor TFIIS